MLEKITSILADKLDVNPADVKAETNFKDDLNIDSLDLFDLVMTLEEEFGVEIPSEDLESLTTVGAMITYLTEKGVN